MCKKIQTIDTHTKHPVVVDEIMHKNTCSLSCQASFCALRRYDGTEPDFFLVTTFGEVIQSVWHDRWRLRFRSFPAARMKLDWSLVRLFFAHSYFLSPTCVVCACFVRKAVAILGEAYVGALLGRLPSCRFSRYIQTNIHKKPVAGKVKTW